LHFRCEGFSWWMWDVKKHILNIIIIIGKFISIVWCLICSRICCIINSVWSYFLFLGLIYMNICWWLILNLYVSGSYRLLWLCTTFTHLKSFTGMCAVTTIWYDIFLALKSWRYGQLSLAHSTICDLSFAMIRKTIAPYILQYDVKFKILWSIWRSNRKISNAN